MKKMITALCATLFGTSLAMAIEPIELPKPDLKETKTLAECLTERQSIRSFASAEVSLQQLSNLLWAADGINRPKSGKRTAPSAMNRKEIELYVLLPAGAYLYNADKNCLDVVKAGDIREGNAPVNILIAARTNLRWAEVDAGFVSQNIYLYCASANLATVARGSFDHKKLADELSMPNDAKLILLHPVGHPAK